MNPRKIRIDWQRVALNLRSHGIQLEAASHRLGKHRGWLGQLARAETGQAVELRSLEERHAQLCWELAELGSEISRRKGFMKREGARK